MQGRVADFVPPQRVDTEVHQQLHYLSMHLHSHMLGLVLDHVQERRVAVRVLGIHVRTVA